jgi:hypothetical protein
VAFDTTLVAVWMCIVGAIAWTSIQVKEQALLADIDDVIVGGLVDRLPYRSEVEELKAQFRDLRSRFDEMLGRAQESDGARAPGRD